MCTRPFALPLDVGLPSPPSRLLRLDRDPRKFTQPFSVRNPTITLCRHVLRPHQTTTVGSYAHRLRSRATEEFFHSDSRTWRAQAQDQEVRLSPHPAPGPRLSTHRVSARCVALTMNHTTRLVLSRPRRFVFSWTRTPAHVGPTSCDGSARCRGQRVLVVAACLLGHPRRPTARRVFARAP